MDHYYPEWSHLYSNFETMIQDIEKIVKDNRKEGEDGPVKAAILPSSIQLF